MADEEETSPLLRGSYHEDSGKYKQHTYSTNRGRVFNAVVQPCIAELFGTAILVAMTTTVIASTGVVIVSPVAVALCHGLAYVTLISALGPVSGGHFNPAITLGAFIGGGVRPEMGVGYILCQLLGSVLGSACAYGMLSYTSSSSESVFEVIVGGGPYLPEGTPPGNAILFEGVFTMALVTIYLMTIVDKNLPHNAAALPIGIVAIIASLIGVNITGACLNPARSFGPAVIMSFFNNSHTLWADHYVYWIGPLAGAVVAAALYRLLFASPNKRLFFK